MSFASPVFLWYFMPATLIAYWMLPKNWRNGLVAVVSLLFYTWGAGPYTFLLLSAIAVNYAAGIAIDADRFAERPGVRRAVLGPPSSGTWASWPSGSTPGSPRTRWMRCPARWGSATPP